MNDPDNELMRRSLDLARRGTGLVSPNPMVGAVVVKDGRIVGEGFHLYSLVKHAEVHALEMAGDEARGATIYCSLEPCCNYGRTSPCTDAIIEAGISKVIVATIDPNPRVNGRGLEILRNAGIEVEVGLDEAESQRLNEIYVKSVTVGRPFVHAVIALNINIDEWNPTNDFTRIASRYDSVVLSDSLNINRLIIDWLSSQQRHRTHPLVTANAESLPENTGKAVENGDAIMIMPENELNFIVEQLAQRDETSVLILPGLVGIDHANQFDKITVLHKSDDDLSAISIDTIESNVRSSNIIETTLYPRRAKQSESD